MSRLSTTIIRLFLCLIPSLPVLAQQPRPSAPLPDHCTSAKAMEDLYKQHPESRKTAAKLASYTKTFIAKAKQQSSQDALDVQYTIPVVFHVNDPANPYKVTMEQIRSAIDILNEDYNLLNADRSLIDPRFAGRMANIHITFRLADIDPLGNPTTGVTYHYNSYTGREPDIEGAGRAVKSVSYWPSEKYLNIWIVSEVEKKGVYNNSGWTFLPDEWAASQHLDGVVYNWRYLGRPGVGCSENGYPYMKRVLSHEIGHFLNLQHTFQNECNAPGDEVDDTPPTKSNYGNCDVNASSCGVVANVENYMDYSECARMFTQGQKDRMLAALNSNVVQRNNLWSAANLAATLLPQPVSRIIFSTSRFDESDVNDGSVPGTDTLRATGGAHFAVSSGTMSSGTHFTTQGLPAGLTVTIAVLNDTTAALTFTGKASQHAAANTDSVRITFLDPAIQGGAGSIYRPYAMLGINFIDPYRIVYRDIPDIIVNSTSTWTALDLGPGDAKFGGWFNNGKLRLETYQKAAVCEGTTRNISPLSLGTLISSASSFVAGGAYPDEHDVYSSTYTKWVGQTAYAGIKFTLNGRTHYGWIRMTVSADGSTLTIRDYAYNETPDAGINAGDPASLSWSASQMKEYKANNGSIRDTIEVSVRGASFAISNGLFINNTHYTINGIPAGMTPRLQAVNNSLARLTLTGIAPNNAAIDNTIVTVTFLPAAFTGNVSVAESSKQISIAFRDPYQIKYVDVNDTTYTANASSNWYYFLVDNIQDASYGLWIDNNGTGNLRFETYRKPMVCNGTTKNISLLPVNTFISDSSHFVAGGDFPDEHMLYSTDYTAWKGKTGFAGFNFTTDGETFYGWFRFKVSANGDSYTLMDYAYNTRPGACIMTGQKTQPPGGVDTTVNAQQYCSASTALNYNTITRVRFANLDNSSGWNGYKDFTSQKATVTAGQSYPLEINLNIEYWPDISVAAWIDWNGDKLLNDTTEKVFVKRASGPYKQTITVPANAKTGATLMRVRMGYGSNVKPCGVDNYQGEVEDYTIQIVNGTAMMAKAITGVNEQSVHTALTAVNPFSDVIYINYQSASSDPALITLYDINGNKVKQQRNTVVKGNNRLQLDNVSSLSPGIYILDVWQGTKRTQIKLTKQ
ncbi:MAG TPA: M43 family zinc metalloprotease [Chitinophaga sp.]|uniref:zinc-dependent metalloprotease n=1 Tax=Chitinophaga sp. TaxID=1869181 RepID=UPI002C939B86|nr:M43 family zinc metalloprotease [Chitinophaga sp.]HVI49151.1 M43 family zinc metalloprotease [Chitinophaga sp.]